jgi:hypothetical protein
MLVLGARLVQFFTEWFVGEIVRQTGFSNFQLERVS